MQSIFIILNSSFDSRRMKMNGTHNKVIEIFALLSCSSSAIHYIIFSENISLREFQF